MFFVILPRKIDERLCARLRLYQDISGVSEDVLSTAG